ncbi:MAG: fluoride efflux transporter CrcB [Gammaproteobacteria bacterium]|nr:MAG: fluoride efflux transporter CrcB [Gammaproteobacteria bacterium]
MSHWLAIAAGGALGAVLRYGLSTAVYALLGRSFPWGTLAVNVAGSLLMGLLYVLLVERLGAGPAWRAALLVGLLGAFTTFSTFSLETFNLMEEGAWALAASNVAASVLLCLAAVWTGIVLGRWL